MEKETIFLKIDFGRSNKNYLTYHSLKKSEQHGYVLGAGKPVTNKLSKALSELFSHNAEKSSLSNLINDDVIPRRIISIHFENRLSRIAWLVPPSKRTITVANENGILSKKILCDIGWYFFNCEHDLYIFAVDYKEAVKSENNASTKLYYAPLMNVDSNGKVCWGDVEVPEFEGNVSEYMIQIEQCFFGGIFNHFSGTLYSADLDELYQKETEIKVEKKLLISFDTIEKINI